MITREDLKIMIVIDAGRVFVVDYAKGVKSEHNTKEDAELFIAAIVNKHNNNVN